MNICFFLDARPIEALLGQDDKLEQICAKLDKGRREKLLERMERTDAKVLPGRAMVESVGAGLLLQYAVAHVMCLTGCDEMHEVQSCEENSQIVTVTCEQLLADSTPAIPLDFYYGEKGKPYFVNIPQFFSLSHSEGRVICALSDEEIGADMQYPRELNEEKLIKRFFSADETEVWQKLNGAERTEFFYRCWTAKEAYGKLTGEGVAAYLGKNVHAMNATKPEWKEFTHDGGYVAICRMPGERNKGVMEQK